MTTLRAKLVAAVERYDRDRFQERYDSVTELLNELGLYAFKLEGLGGPRFLLDDVLLLSYDDLGRLSVKNAGGSWEKVYTPHQLLRVLENTPHLPEDF